MSDLFRKLNVLVKSSLNDLLQPQRSRTRQEPRLGREVDREIDTLRSRINEAVAYEETLKARLRQHQTEVERWDAQADEAVARDDDASARHAVEQMKRAEQRRAIAENDLKAHQLVTQDLIVRVNQLEAAVADARRSQQAAGEANIEKPLRRLDDVLHDARARVGAMGDLLAAKDDVNRAAPEVAPPDRQVVDDDLAQRRQRLSK